MATSAPASPTCFTASPVAEHRSCTGVKASFKVGLKLALTLVQDLRIWPLLSTGQFCFAGCRKPFLKGVQHLLLFGQTAFPAHCSLFRLISNFPAHFPSSVAHCQPLLLSIQSVLLAVSLSCIKIFVADPDSHYFWKLYPDPRWSKKPYRTVEPRMIKTTDKALQIYDLLSEKKSKH